MYPINSMLNRPHHRYHPIPLKILVVVAFLFSNGGSIVHGSGGGIAEGQNRVHEEKHIPNTSIHAPGGWCMVMVDMQKKFPLRGMMAGMSEHRAYSVLKPITATLRRLEPYQIPVAILELRRPYDKKPNDDTLPELMKEIKGHLPYAIIHKQVNDGFFMTTLDETLKNWGAKKLIMCGVNRSVCVRATARSAVELGYEIYVPDRLMDDYEEVYPKEFLRFRDYRSEKIYKSLATHFTRRTRTLLNIIDKDLKKVKPLHQQSRYAGAVWK